MIQLNFNQSCYNNITVHYAVFNRLVGSYQVKNQSNFANQYNGIEKFVEIPCSTFLGFWDVFCFCLQLSNMSLKHDIRGN